MVTLKYKLLYFDSVKKDLCLKMEDLQEMKLFSGIGFELSNLGNLTKTLQSNDCSCCQIFLSGTKQYKPRKLSGTEIEESCKLCLDKNMTCYVHCPYVINLASEDSGVRSRGRESVLDHLRQTSDFPCSCVLHTGSGKISTVANELNSMLIPVGKYVTPLLLEVCAGEGKKIGSTETDIRKVWESLDSPSDRIGLCLDTQHLFASGMCDFSSNESVVKLFENMESIVGKVGLVHINDSAVVRLSKKDRHASIGEGHIWGTDLSTLGSVINYCQSSKVDMVLETYISPKKIKILGDLYTQFI